MRHDVRGERVSDLADVILELADKYRCDTIMTKAGLMRALCHPELYQTTRMYFEFGLLPEFFDDEEFDEALQRCIDCGRLRADGAGVYRYHSRD
jgi:hypothetical protein